MKEKAEKNETKDLRMFVELHNLNEQEAKVRQILAQIKGFKLFFEQAEK